MVLFIYWYCWFVPLIPMTSACFNCPPCICRTAWHQRTHKPRHLDKGRKLLVHEHSRARWRCSKSEFSGGSRIWWNGGWRRHLSEPRCSKHGSIETGWVWDRVSPLPIVEGKWKSDRCIGDVFSIFGIPQTPSWIHHCRIVGYVPWWFAGGEGGNRYVPWW